MPESGPVARAVVGQHRAGDAVAAWLHPDLADRLEAAGLFTLAQLADRINGIGRRWVTGIAGIGPVKGERILAWLREHEASHGLVIGAHVAVPRQQLQPHQLEAVLPPATAIRPLEKLIVPADLDGRHGLYRRPPEQCLLKARNDLEAVWAWLAQIGQDRGGFYSYQSLENLAGCNLHNADRIHPEWQLRVVGETVRLHPATGLKLARFEPGHSYAFEGGWYFALQPVDHTRTRLFARSRVPRGLPSLAYAVFIELPHFIMERKMLLGIKARAEQ